MASIPIGELWGLVAIVGAASVIGIIKRSMEIYEARADKVRELMNMMFDELHYHPHFSPNVTTISTNQFAEMFQSKESYCIAMNRLARELKVGCEFKVKDGVIDIEVRRENKK